MNDTPANPRGRLSTLTNAIVSGSATIIALVALATGLYQAKLSRDQANASVWPFLLQRNSGNNGYSRIVQNVGIGPARVMAFEMLVDGRPMHSWREVTDSLHVRTFRAAIAAERRFETWICYCSIYGKCWAGTVSVPPADVRSCRNDPARAFRDD